MKCLSMKECVRMLLAFIEYANETRRFHDVGNYEYIVRTIKQVDKKISNLEVEITELNICITNQQWELEANKKEIAESMPKENVMNLAREIRSKQDEAIAEECFAESDIYGEVFDQIVKLLTNNKEGDSCDHEFVSADNQVVTGAEICTKCKTVRTKDSVRIKG